MLHQYNIITTTVMQFTICLYITVSEHNLRGIRRYECGITLIGRAWCLLRIQENKQYST